MSLELEFRPPLRMKSRTQKTIETGTGPSPVDKPFLRRPPKKPRLGGSLRVFVQRSELVPSYTNSCGFDLVCAVSVKFAGILQSLVQNHLC